MYGVVMFFMYGVVMFFNIWCDVF